MGREDTINQAAIKYTKGTNSYRDIVLQDTFMEGLKSFNDILMIIINGV